MIVWIGGTAKAYRPPPPDRRRHVERVPSSANPKAIKNAKGRAAAEAQEATHAYQEPLPKQRRPVIKAQELMTRRIYTVGPQDTTDTARRILTQIKAHHLPVVDDNQILIGILSDRDLLRAQLIEARDGLMLVADVMTRKVLAAQENTPIREIAGTFAAQSIHAMPIINESGQLTGLITATDILATLVNRAPLDLWS